MARRRENGRAVQQGVQPPSRALLRFFDVYLRRYMPKHFHALRLAGAERWSAAGRPLIVCLNHPSWWDPLVCIQLSRALAPSLQHYAPIDAAAVARYGVLRKLGLFPVEQETQRGARQFLRSAAHVLEQPNAVLWLTPQGSFTDARVRPVQFRSGLDALLRRLPAVTVLPLALEYVFWNERMPEALARFGDAVELNGTDSAPGTLVEAALAATQDALAALAIERDPDGFQTIFSAARGTGGIYGLWQSLRSGLRGEGLRLEHGSLLRKPARTAEGLRTPARAAEGLGTPAGSAEASHE